MKPELYIGLISGTSIDSVDCVLVDFSKKKPLPVDFYNLDIPAETKTQILQLCGDGPNQIQAYGELDVELGKLFARAVLEILKRNNLKPSQISAIGSHGQTIRHRPSSPDHGPGVTTPFTLQIADPNTIAELTGITTVADFRRRDIAAGGQGAPLLPAYHGELFRSEDSDRVILNIGGMSNITVLYKNESKITGFDTGPGNVLLDIWIDRHLAHSFDDNGRWSASGDCNARLLQILLDEKYFAMPFPKSTGRELFNAHWLEQKLEHFNSGIRPEDVQATLLQLTTTTICDAITGLMKEGELIVCGGGAKNSEILKNLAEKLPAFKVYDSLEQGYDPDSIEAIAFAWLAKQALEKKAVDYSSITGAKHPNVLGGIYFSTPAGDSPL